MSLLQTYTDLALHLKQTLCPGTHIQIRGVRIGEEHQSLLITNQSVLNELSALTYTDFAFYVSHTLCPDAHSDQRSAD